jgi:hypothetical protein
MPRRKVRPSQHRFSLNSRPQTTVRLQFFTDPNRKKNVGNTDKILFSASVMYYFHCTDFHETHSLTVLYGELLYQI